MRKKFIEFLMNQAERDPNCYLVVGDVGYSVVEPFAEKFPDRYINAGVAEQNMIGMAAGLAMAGKRVYAYSIVPFACMRPFEQIRDDLCYQNLPVIVVGNGGGFSYGQAGVTHHAIEDVAIMRALPGMTVVAPGSFYELEALLPILHEHPGPVYLRFGPCDNLVVYDTKKPVVLGKPIELVPSKRALMIASGQALDIAFKAHQLLVAQGIDIGLVSMPTIKPLDTQYLRSKQNLSLIVTVEEHSVIGGLADAISACCAQQIDHHVKVVACGVNDYYAHTVGSREYLCKEAGLEPELIVQKVLNVYQQYVILQQPIAGYKELSW